MAVNNSPVPPELFFSKQQVPGIWSSDGTKEVSAVFSVREIPRPVELHSARAPLELPVSSPRGRASCRHWDSSGGPFVRATIRRATVGRCRTRRGFAGPFRPSDVVETFFRKERVED